jgi:ribose 1,5-bisphosphokinase PhnN
VRLADTKLLLEIIKRREKNEPVVDTAADLKNMATRQRRKYEEIEIVKITDEIQVLFERLEQKDEDIKARNEQLWEEQALLMVNIQVR